MFPVLSLNVGLNCNTAMRIAVHALSKQSRQERFPRALVLVVVCDHRNRVHRGEAYAALLTAPAPPYTIGPRSWVDDGATSEVEAINDGERVDHIGTNTQV